VRGGRRSSLYELLDGFLGSKVLMTALELDLFTVVAGGIDTRARLIDALGLPLRSTKILVDACVALELLDEDGGQLSVPEALRPDLLAGDSGAFNMVRYLAGYYAEVYRDLDRMAELVRSDGASSRFHLRDYFKEDVADVDPELAADYSAYMHATMERIAGTVIETYSFARHRVLLDLCGGPGTFCAAVLRANPGLRGAFLDVPAVVDVGSRTIGADPELDGRIEAIAGDAFTAPLAGDADVITICRSAHDWDDSRVEALFCRVHEALPAGGRFLIVERMLPEEVSAADRGLCLRAVYFLSKSRTACYRSPGDYRRMLGAAGFSDVRAMTPARDPYQFFRGLHIVIAVK
jgi:demethylspheroidene O-methyltransferase